VTAEQRNRLYYGAEVFLFLSLYEGFGLPILEAMRCGAPVLCSNRSSCPEVAGDAAFLVDPADEDAAAGALVAMLSATPSEREQWQLRGRTRERQFTWTRTAEMTLRVYDRVARGNPDEG
jgi:glycosyltransferase involved in cell wall biosynthesis